MKICAVISSLELGGAELTFRKVVESLSQAGWPIHVVTLLPDDDRPRMLHSEVSYQCLHLSSRGMSLPQKVFTYLKIIRQLRKTLIKQRATVVLSFMGQTNLLCLIASIGLRTKRVVAERVHPDFAPVLEGPLPKSFLRWIRNRIYLLADVITVQGKLMKEAFPESLHNKIAVIPNAVREIVVETRDRENIILSVGRLVPQKDHRTLIEGFAQIAGECPDWKLRIVGSGPLREELSDLADSLGVSSQLEFVDKTENLGKHFQECRIFAHASRFEGFSNVVIEALSFGLPVVATDCPGATSEILSEGKFGLLVPVGDSEAVGESSRP